MRVFQKLPLRNVTRRPLRSAALICLVAALSFALLAGAVTVTGMRRGVSSLRRRLGADIMVVPEEAAGKSGIEGMVLQGNTTYFYMDDTVLDEAAGIEGVGECTPQIYLASLAASCCSAKVQLIGYDPETDFTIQPWIRDSFDRPLEKMEIVVGSDIVSDEGETLTFYDTPCTVAAKLTKTGTNYDRCVFAGDDTIRELTQSSVGKQLNQFKDVDPNHVISCILINVKEGADIDEVAERINSSIDGVTALRSGSLVAGTAESLNSIAGMVRILIVVLAVLAFVILAISFTMLIHERKREFGILRVLGVSQGALSRSVWSEAALISLAGSIAGCVLGVIVTIPFGGALQRKLDMPMLLPQAGTILLYIAAALLICLAAGSLASVWSVLRVSRADISTSLREEK